MMCPKSFQTRILEGEECGFKARPTFNMDEYYRGLLLELKEDCMIE